MIHYIKISNFEAIREEIELNFEARDEEGSPTYLVEMLDGRKLLKLAYIYGANASGKTTVLRAIGFLRTLWLNPVNIKEDTLRYTPFLFRPDAEAFRSSMELAFYFDNIRYVYNVSFNRTAILQEKLVVYNTRQPSELYTRATDLTNRLSNIDFGQTIDAPKAALNALASATLHNNTVIGAFQKTNVALPLFNGLSEWANRHLPQLVHVDSNLSEFTGYGISQTRGFKEWMGAFMNRADQQIRGVDVKAEKDEYYNRIQQGILKQTNPIESAQPLQDIGKSRQILFYHALPNNDVYALPIEFESRGSVRYFGLGGLLYTLLTIPTFQMIDELDTSLHADLMKFYLEVYLLNSTQSQLLFTTHNLFLLEDANLIRRDALWFTERDETGAVSLFSAADFDSGTLRKGASLINAYKSGRLGAKPNLGSPYLNQP